MVHVALADIPPSARRLTAYDREQAKTYLRLLDAEAAGATWQDVVGKVFGEDPAEDPPRLERKHAAHWERARWMRDSGYLQLRSQAAG